MQTLVILPTYKEAENITAILRAIRSSVIDIHVLVVDDASPDGTAELAEKLSLELGGIYLLKRRAKSGLGSAYREGFAWGLEQGYEALIEMDADFSHDPGALGSLINAVEQGADLVIGSRYVQGGSIPNWTLHRRLLSQWGNIYAAYCLGLPIRDLTSGFRVFRASLLQNLDLDKIQAEGYGFQIEMAYKSQQIGAKIVEVPISFTDRVKGESKMSMKTVIEALFLVGIWGILRVTGIERLLYGNKAKKLKSYF